jgi:uncharacterized protein (TIGR02246 family)
MVAFLALAAAVATAQPSCEALTRAARPAIEHANADWVRAMQAGDAAAIAAAYADDGLFVLPDGAVAKGRAAVEALYARGRANAARIVGGGIESQGTACGDGGLIFEWGRGALRVRGADGRETEQGGAYLTVWKEIGGGWKIVRNMSSIIDLAAIALPWAALLGGLAWLARKRLGKLRWPFRRRISTAS